MRGSAQANGNVDQGGTRGMAPLSDGIAIQVLDADGGGTSDRANDPLAQLIDRATREHGILFTVAAGNSRPR